MQGAGRVMLFCFLTTILPSILIILPLYLRHVRYAEVMYKVSESDVIQIHDGQSNIFCEKHSLKMNSSFHAFQMYGTPEISNSRKHIRLKKSMSLPDDTLEYWGFYLLKGATLELKACSRYEGSKVLLVKGEKTLNTCGILDDRNRNKVSQSVMTSHENLIVTLESPAELIDFVGNNKNNIESDGKNNAAEEISGEVNGDYDFDQLTKYAQKHMEKGKNFHHIKLTHDSKNFHGLNKNGNDTNNARKKREKVHYPHTLLDRGFNHGGNALNHSKQIEEDSSVSSFENNLMECYNGKILSNNPLPYSNNCKNVLFLEKTTTLKILYDVPKDGYYYYIFYSDNDFVRNDIHAIFDIYKPTFQYANLSESKVCINNTECNFPVNFLTKELVIVEVPTKDGIEHEEDDSSILISTCHPRMGVYVIFPISVLLLILLCAFL